MIRVPFGSVLIGLIAIVAVGGLIASTAPNQSPKSRQAELIESVSNGACQKTGITLVVDFGSNSNRDLVKKCVQGFTGNGWQLIEAAGIAVEGTNEYPEAFVCRLANFPSAADEDCLGTPEFRNGSWVYFYSSKEISDEPTWTQSPNGAASRNPGCGEFEAWLFVNASNDSARKLPSISPKPFLCK